MPGFFTDGRPRFGETANFCESAGSLTVAGCGSIKRQLPRIAGGWPVGMCRVGPDALRNFRPRTDIAGKIQSGPAASGVAGKRFAAE